VLGRQDRHERVVHEVVEGQRAGGGRAALARPVVDEGQVDLPGPHARQGLRDGVLLEQDHLEFGVAAQAAHDRAREGDGDGGERGDGDPAARLGGLGGEVGLGRVDRLEDVRGVGDEAAARVGQLGRAGGPLQERHAGLLLQGGQLL
jgi:hypothetical protein